MNIPVAADAGEKEIHFAMRSFGCTSITYNGFHNCDSSFRTTELQKVNNKPQGSSNHESYQSQNRWRAAFARESSPPISKLVIWSLELLWSLFFGPLEFSQSGASSGHHGRSLPPALHGFPSDRHTPLPAVQHRASILRGHKHDVQRFPRSLRERKPARGGIPMPSHTSTCSRMQIRLPRASNRNTSHHS